MKHSDFLKKQVFGKSRPIQPLIRIYCEGETEVAYFNQLRLEYRLNLDPIPKDEKQRELIKFVDEQIDNNKISFKDNNFDSVWCVIDVEKSKDYWEKHISEIRLFSDNKNKFVIVSNPCFELWLLLHFKYTTRSCTGQELEEELSKLLKEKYKKPDSVTRFKEKFITLENISLAIANSKKLIAFHNKEGRDAFAFQSNPCTSMHFLAEKIIELKKI